MSILGIRGSAELSTDEQSLDARPAWLFVPSAYATTMQRNTQTRFFLTCLSIEDSEEAREDNLQQ